MKATIGIFFSLPLLILWGCRGHLAPVATTGPTTSPATQSSHIYNSTPQVFSFATDEIRVPFRLDDRSHHILVDGQVNGVSGQCIIDTGSAEIFIARPLALQAKLPDTRTFDVDAGDGIATSQRHLILTYVPSLQIGGLSLNGFDAAEDPNFSQQQLGAGAVLLGRPAFKGILLTVDYDHSVVILRKGSLPPADGRRILQMHEDEHGCPLMPVIVADKPVEVEPDTGDYNTLLLGGRDGEGLNLHFPRYPVPAHGIYGTATGWLGRLWGAAIVGDTVFQDPLLVTSADRGVSTIGYRFLSAFTTTFDFANLRVQLDPISPRQTMELSNMPFHCDFDRKVVAVDAGSTAEKSGMLVGDQILSINGDVEDPSPTMTIGGPQTIPGPAIVHNLNIPYGVFYTVDDGGTAPVQLPWIQEAWSPNGKSNAHVTVRNWSADEKDPILVAVRRGDKTVWLRLNLLNEKK